MENRRHKYATYDTGDHTGCSNSRERYKERKVLENGKTLESRKVPRKEARAVVHEW